MRTDYSPLVLLVTLIPYNFLDYQEPGYAVALPILLLAAAQVIPRLRKGSGYELILFTWIYGTLTLISAIACGCDINEYWLQGLAYPVVFAAAAAVGARSFYTCKANGFDLVLLLILLANVLYAMLDVVSLAPSLAYANESNVREVFGLPMKASSGLIFNLNYYSLVNITGGWWLLHRALRPRNNGAYFCVLSVGAVICFFGALLGSSRSGLAILLFSLLVYLSAHAFSPRAPRSEKRIGIALSGAFLIPAFLLIGLYALGIYSDSFRESLRLYDGLNNRLAIWGAAASLAGENPLTGLFDIVAIKHALLANGAGTNTAQSGYLYTALRIGIPGLVITLVVGAIASIRYMSAWYRFDKSAVALWCAMIAVLMDNIVRTYSLGGLGFMPAILSIAYGYSTALSSKFRSSEILN